PIFRAKVMSPLRDTMRFVDGDELHIALLQKHQNLRPKERFGSDVKQLRVAAPYSIDALHVLRIAQGAVQGNSRYSRFAKVVDLVMHEGDQGRYDNGQPVVYDCGKLVAKRFA